MCQEEKIIRKHFRSALDAIARSYGMTESAESIVQSAEHSKKFQVGLDNSALVLTFALVEMYLGPGERKGILVKQNPLERCHFGSVSRCSRSLSDRMSSLGCGQDFIPPKRKRTADQK